MNKRRRRISKTGQIIVGLTALITFASCSDQEERQLTTNDASARGSNSGNQAVTLPGRDGEITVSELKSALDRHENIFLLDVRTRAEYEAGHIAEVDVLIPHTQILSQAVALPADTNQYIYCVCRSGRRSGYVTRWLRENGYSHSYNVIGGMLAWVESGYPVTR